MADLVEVNLLRVFVDSNGNFGCKLGIVIDEDQQINPRRRQEITELLGFSETVFIDDLNKASVSIYSHQGQIPFAGAPLLGIAWFIGHRVGRQIKSTISMSNTVKVIHEENLLWIVIDAKNKNILPQWKLEELKASEDVDEIKAVDRPKEDHSMVWAWIDSNSVAANVRARTFAPGWGISEEEANGSGSLLLTGSLGQDLIIQHGQGSMIRTRHYPKQIAIGGLVKQEDSITL